MFTILAFKQACQAKPAMAEMEAMCQHSLKANQRKYSKEQTPSDPRRTENDVHNNPKKDDQSENWQVLCDSDGARFAVVLTCCQQ